MTEKDIKNLYKEFQVPKHIIKHMETVAFFAAKLSDRLLAIGKKVDKELVVIAALIHDSLRVCDFKEISQASFPYKVSTKQIKFWQQLKKKYQKYGHEKALANILKKKGEKALANLVSKHGFFSIDKLKTIEEKILYYADKRVEKDKIVSLKERLKLGKSRNMKMTDNLKKVQTTDRKIIKLEKELEKLLGKRID